MPADQWAATVGDGRSMSGTLTQGGSQQPCSASLALGWVASDQAGVWQKANATSACLVFAVLNTGAGPLAVLVDARP